MRSSINLRTGTTSMPEVQALSGPGSDDQVKVLETLRQQDGCQSEYIFEVLALTTRSGDHIG